jgi:hypothetical protein
MIIDHLANPDDFQGEVVIIDRMNKIGQQVIGRMLHDKMKCELLVEKAIPGFDVNSVSFEVIGPIFDNDFGVLYSFKYISCLVMEYNPAIWRKN